MSKNYVISLIMGGTIRFYLANSQLQETLANRVEITTPLNSFKRVLEGVHLYKHGIDPYTGDVVHEMPALLFIVVKLFSAVPAGLVPLLYIAMDLLTACMLYKLSVHFVKEKLNVQAKSKSLYAANTEELQLQTIDSECIPRFVLLAYLFNPLSVMSCAALTSTVFSNFFLATILYCLVKKHLLACLVVLAFESMRSLYPVVLIAPAVIIFSYRSIGKAVAIVGLFVALCCGVTGLNYVIMQNWNYLDGTLGFIFFYRDLQPNIGLFWYFFTEMFEHFRTMFLITFQMNATLLYLIPLSLKLRKEPMLLATVLIALMSVFRSYPCLGDVSFYLALLPIWRRCWKFMAHNFVVFAFFICTLSMLPALWHLWIYAGSANANFYFGTTLAFSTGQIFLVTDLLFAYVKREFCLYNGLKIFVDGKEAKIILE